MNTESSCWEITFSSNGVNDWAAMRSNFRPRCLARNSYTAEHSASISLGLTRTQMWTFPCSVNLKCCTRHSVSSSIEVDDFADIRPSQRLSLEKEKRCNCKKWLWWSQSLTRAWSVLRFWSSIKKLSSIGFDDNFLLFAFEKHVWAPKEVAQLAHCATSVQNLEKVTTLHNSFNMP